MNCSDKIYQMRYRIDNMSEMLKNNTNFKSRERRNIFQRTRQDFESFELFEILFFPSQGEQRDATRVGKKQIKMKNDKMARDYK